MFVFATLMLRLLLLAGPYHVDADFRFKLFHMAQNNTVRMSRLRDVTAVESSSRCALECLAQDSFCEAFQFDLDSKTCYLGNWIWFNRTALPYYLTVFSTRKQYCNTSLGYNITLNGDQGMCVFLSLNKLTYNDSKTQCSAKQGRLLIIKTQIKMNLTYLFLNSTGYSYTTILPLWVGIEKSVGQQDFVWLDQEPVNPTLFASGQPDLPASNACVVIREAGLDDVDCMQYFGHLCEYIGETEQNIPMG